MTEHLRLRRRTAAAVSGLAAAAVAAATLAAPGVAATGDAAPAAIGAPCPAAFPPADLVRATSTTPGTLVEGLTVSSGTTPDAITGEFVGTLEDGIAPGVDMLIFKMQGSRITDADGKVDRGIWAGMSGSPLYTADGRLVGAVAYGQSYAPSDYAGVTPAAALYAADHRSAPKSAAKITGKVATAMRATGASAAASTGAMRRLPTPIALPAGVSAAKAKKIAKRAKLKNVTFRAGGASSKTSSVKIPVSAGSNVAASYSYGSTPLAAIGTTTAVCGDKVFAFGHPMDWMGKTTMSMHGADAVYVERDLDGSFKLANIGAPVGSFTQDRLAAIVGSFGAAPKGTVVKTTNRFANRSRTSTSTVASPDWVSYLASMQSTNDSWTVTDGTFGGQANATRTIKLRRANGQVLTYRRTDVYADSMDITAGAADEFAGDIDSILSNGFEKVTVVSATQTSTVKEGYRAYTIGKVEAKQRGKWSKVTAKTGVMARRGATLRLRVTLVREADAQGAKRKVVNLAVKVPRKKVKRNFGVLTIAGGSSMGYDEDEFFEEFLDIEYASAGDARTLPAMLKEMSRAEHGNDVTATLSIGTGRNAAERSARKATSTVVSGEVELPVIRFDKAPKKKSKKNKNKR